jgi:hypothetical protein
LHLFFTSWRCLKCVRRPCHMASGTTRDALLYTAAGLAASGAASSAYAHAHVHTSARKRAHTKARAPASNMHTSNSPSSFTVVLAACMHPVVKHSLICKWHSFAQIVTCSINTAAAAAATAAAPAAVGSGSDARTVRTYSSNCAPHTHSITCAHLHSAFSRSL